MIDTIVTSMCKVRNDDIGKRKKIIIVMSGAIHSFSLLKASGFHLM